MKVISESVTLFQTTTGFSEATTEDSFLRVVFSVILSVKSYFITKFGQHDKQRVSFNTVFSCCKLKPVACSLRFLMLPKQLESLKIMEKKYPLFCPGDGDELEYDIVP